MKKSILLIFITFLCSCHKNKIDENNSMYYDNFYSIVNDLVRFRFTNVSSIYYVTIPIHKEFPPCSQILYNSTILQPPPPPGTIYYGYSLFKSEVDRKHFTSSEAKFMYNSIDSTKFFKIDSSRIIVRVFKKTIYDRIHQRNGLDLMYDELERIYGSSEFLMISTPIFDSTYTKAIISVDLHCGSLCGQGNEFILEKQRGIWRIITVYYTWES